MVLAVSAEMAIVQWVVSLLGLLVVRTAGSGSACSQCIAECGISCLDGEYVTNSTCTPCPAGYKCPEPSLQPQACSSGQYSENASTVCILCPSGHSCLDPSQSPVECTAGTYSLAGSAACTVCPEGSYSLNGEDGCLECPPGHFCRNGTTTHAPMACDAGEHSPGGVATCSPCPEGSYSGGGAEVCVSCDPGNYCPLGSSAPLPCPQGSWSPGQASTCDLCPGGYSCEDATVTPLPCQPGEWSPIGNSSCMACPAGSSCVDPTQPPPLCELGYYSPLGEAYCRLCPAGYNCSSGDLSLCPEGHYSPLGSSECEACPVGHACPFPFLPPTLCASGQHTSGATGATLCSDCPPGFYCPSLSLAPLACPNGTYSTGGSTVCSLCPPGYQCPTADALPVLCIPGYQSSEGSTECSPCPAGFGCPLSSDPTLNFACTSGLYSPEGERVCLSCPAGSACPNTSVSVVCEAGTFSLEGYTVCEPCPAGWACSYTDGHGNAPCTLGTFSSGNATSCTLCPAGNACASTDLPLPVPCSQGSYAEEGQTSCTPCPAGFSCVDTSTPPTELCTPGSYSSIGMADCVVCPAGWACPSTMTSDDIITCVPGTYSLDMFTQCMTCPAGSYCPNTTVSPIPCPTGHYSVEGSIACTPCPPGFSCSQPNALPIICDVGTYSPGGSSICLTCQSGFMCEQGSVAANLSTSTCSLGYYCPDGGSQLACPSGTYGNTTGLTDSSECSTCPAGFFCPLATPGYPSTSLRCPLGHYCPSGTTTQFEFPCTDGSYSTTFGLERDDQCLMCPAGRHCSGGDGIGGQLCPRGHYCPEGSSSPTACTGGTYTEATGSDEIVLCKECPAGFYCTSGTDSPSPCLPGTFNPLTGQDNADDCQPCTAGRACSTLALTQTNELCSAGHFCPEGSDKSADPANECLAGTFTDYHNLTVADECSICPAGLACPSGTGGVSTPRLACAVGHFCPNGTQFPTQYPCAAGFYGNKTTLQRQEECEVCPAGMYCVGGASAPSGPCDQGHYCPPGTRSATEFPCPAGTYFDQTGNVRIQNCLECTPGHYCPSGSVLPTACNPGTFSDTSGAPDMLTCQSCPGGYHCPNSGMVTPTPCQIGFFSDNGASSCMVCSPGYYCDNMTTSLVDLHMNKICAAGLTCAAGGLTNPPNLLMNACPSGQYCLPGDMDPDPIPCPNGTYTPLTGRKSVEQCTPCPPGMFCSPEGRTQPAGPCTPGHYCPLATRYENEFPCPISTFLANASAESLESCTTCISGFYCPQTGLGEPIICPRGFFCVTGSNAPQACPPGTYGNSTGLRRSQECLPCPGGQYCGGAGLSAPTGPCDAGFFCRSRASVSAPTDGITGDVCPRGGFCPQGSAIQANCPVGTYGNSTGNRGPEDCIACDPGSFCSGDNNPSPTGPCDEGCYCPGGANSSCQIPTPAGSFSIVGQAAPTPCFEGTFQSASRQASCTSCLPGLFCEERGLTLGTPCPAGSYCPAGSILPTPCPRGTFSVTEGLFNVSACDLCTPGSYCASENLTATTGLCNPGHYCLAGAELPNPGFAGESYGGLCPAGHYCLEGTSSPFQYPCPPGTFNPSMSRTSPNHCLFCTGGYVCSEFALSSPNEGCSPGHFCSINATHSTPVGESWGDVCPVGHVCPGNTSQPVVCPDGSFTSVTGAVVCSPCTAGSYCVNGTMVLECPPGFYCPEGTGLDWMPCPSGTYNPGANGSSLDDCLPCPGGRFCAGTAISVFDGAEAGDCSPGYYCLEGIDSPTPTQPLLNGTGGECPQGFYCPMATQNPAPCPPGTFSNSVLLTDVSECRNCTPGMYCGENNLTTPSGDCDGGFVCSGGAVVPNPPGNDSTGYPCPAGRYCPPGTSIPLPCNPGEFNPLEGQAVCFMCEPGYYCLEGSLTFNDTICPMGHYCPEGTTHPFAFPCPQGTYRTDVGAQDLTDCTPCDPGEYCTGGQGSPDGLCDPGWYCIRGASSPQPFDLGVIDVLSNVSQQCYCANVTVGGQCEPGFYCPGGSNMPMPCPSGMYCEGLGAVSPTGDCLAGFYCMSGASVPNPNDGVTGFPCPSGHYCDVGVVSPAPCPMGTYLNASGSDNSSDCVPCTGGFYCASDGLTLPTGPCFPGYYCPEGSVSPNNASYICTPGHYCPTGSESERICEGGTYQPNFGEPNCTVCPERSYCPFNASNPLAQIFDCPPGFYCPVGTSLATEFACPLGTYSSQTNRGSLEECVPCPGGRYCATEGLTSSDGSGPCLAGYYCNQSAFLPNPTDGITGDICLPGYYCPEDSTIPIPCPIGTFAPTNGSMSLMDCLACSPGEYCDGTGLSQPTGSCEPGYFCVGGSTTPTPMDNVFGDVCELGHFCPGGTSQSLPCLPGSFSSLPLATNCSLCPAGFYCTNSSSDPLMCPPGYYCPRGTGFDQLPCPPGTFSSSEGLSTLNECTLCTGGSYCSGVASTAVTGQCDPGFFCTEGSDSPTPDGLGSMSVAGPCPEGSYCPMETTLPFPCPPGTFSNVTHLFDESQCLLCSPGSYCEDSGLSVPNGLCFPGYYCILGSSSPAPLSNDTTGDVCPIAHFCPEGSVMPLACEPGSYNPNIGREQCLSCPAGFFCPGNSTEVDLVCPVGHYCPPGTSFPVPCPAGTFNSLTGRQNLSDCEPCSPGLFCAQSGLASPSGLCAEGWYCSLGSPSSQPDNPLHGGLCEPGFFCPNGSSSPQPCSPGFYCNSFGLSAVTGPCMAGFSCTQGAAVPNPNDTVTGDLCACGHYCPLATGTPQPCPSGFYSSDRGNIGQGDCAPCDEGSYCMSEGLCSPSGPCAAGYYCPSGQSLPEPSDYVCVPGHSCPEGSAMPVPCEAGLFQNSSGQSICLPCPPGHYCAVGSVEPVICPPGTLRNESNGASENDCEPCTRGYYCPTRSCQPQDSNSTINNTISFLNIVFAINSSNDSNTSLTCPSSCDCSVDVTIDSNLHGIPCSAGTYCPPGSDTPLLCPGGFTCQAKSSQPTPCEAGYYCTPGSEMARRCEFPGYCPSMSGLPLSCPSGHLSRNTSTRVDTLRTSVSDSCFACLAGFFSDDGTECYECPAGFFCPAQTSNGFDFPCPTGSYCPSGSATPTPCPSGSYNRLPMAQNASQCLTCPINSFQSLSGQVACTPCGSSSESVEDRTTCQCLGDNRAFLPLTGACVCMSGFSFFDEAGQPDSNSDSPLACQSIVDVRCTISEARLASSRMCVDPSSYSCQEECLFQGGSGSFSVSLGVCDCPNQVDPLALCTGDCLTCRPELVVRRSENNTLLFSARDCNGTVLMELEVVGVFGVSAVDTANRRAQMVSHTADGQVTSAFPTSNDEALNLISALSQTGRRKRSISKRQAVSQSSEITNPLLCLETGELVFFAISQADNNTYHYPVYVKDHLLNTNPDFDFGPFAQLGTLLESSVTISTFVHVFNTAGTYVFADSLTPGSVTAVIVVEPGTTCVRDNQDFRVRSLSTATLNQFGVARLPTINQEPDFGAIFGILATTLFLVILAVLLVFIWKPGAAGIKTPITLQPAYRRVDEPKVIYVGGDYSLDTLEKRGVGVGEVNSQPQNFLLENFNVRTLYDKLEDQNLHVSAQLSRQRDDLQVFYDQVIQQVEGLKGLVSETQVMDLVETSRAFRPQLSEQKSEQRMEPVGAEHVQPVEAAKPASLSAEQESVLVDLLRKLLTKAGYKGRTAKRPRMSARLSARRSVKREDLTTAITMVQDMESDHVAEIQTASKTLSEKLSTATTDEEVSKLLEEYEDSMAVLEARQDLERRKQREDLKKKLAMRRNKKSGGDKNKEELVSTCEYRGSLAVSEEITQECSERTQASQERRVQVEEEIQSLVETTLTSLSEGGALDAHTKDQLLKEYVRLRNTEQLRERQLSQVKGRMSERMKDRRAKLQSKHQSKRAETEATLTHAVENKTLTEAAKEEMLKELDAQHKLEQKTLTSQMSTEIAITMATLSQQMDQQSAQREVEIALDFVKKGGAASGKSQEEVEQLCKEFKNQAEEVKSKVESKKRLLTAKLKSRQEQRKQLKMAEAVQQVMSIHISETDVVIPPVELKETLEEKALIDQQERVRDDLKAKQEMELVELAKDLEKDASSKEGELIKQLEEGKEKMVNERRQRLQAKLEGNQHSEEQRKQLLIAHKAELEGLEKRLDTEKDRQLLALREKLRAKRDQKLDDQRRRQEFVFQKELLEQRKEMDVIKTKQAKEAESKAIVEGIKNNTDEAADIVIRKVLEQRQKREIEQLESDQEAEKQHVISIALLECQTKHNQLRENLLAQHEEQLLSVESEEGRAEMIKSQQEELSQMEEKLKRECEEIDSSLKADLEAKHARAKLELREKHYKEYLSALTELAPDTQTRNHSLEAASTAAKELEEVKGQLEADRAKRETHFQAERESFERTQNQLLKDTLRDFEQELEEEEKIERGKLQESLAALQEERDRIITERKEKIKERITQTNESSSYQQKLLQSHNEDTQKLVNVIDAQRLRMQADLQERINKRKRDKLKTKEKSVQKDMLAKKQEMEEKEMQERRKMALEEAAKLDSLQQGLETSLSVVDVTFADELEPEHDEPEPEGLPLSQQELFRLIQVSPLYQRLEQIKVLLSTQGLSHSVATSPEGYIDAEDAQWVRDTELHIMDVSALSPRYFVVYKFACCVIQSLETSWGHLPITLLIADKIPPNHHFHHNTFRNSFAYDPKNRILYMRVQRLENAGQFLLVLVHVLAHVKISSFESDWEHPFVREFYRALAFICNDFFLSKYRMNSSVSSKYADNSRQESSQSFLQSLFNASHTVAGKADIVDDLVDNRALMSTDIHEKQFTSEGVISRLQQYAQFQISSKLKSYLDELESDRRDDTTPPTSGGFERATRSLDTKTTDTKSWTLLRRMSRKKLRQDKLQYRQLLSIQIAHLKERVKEIEAEYQMVEKERLSISERIKMLEAELAEEQNAMRRLEEGSKELQSQKAVVKNILSRLSAARTEQATFDLRINGCSKRLEGFKLQLEQKTEALNDYI